jgi:hypothetical protein
MKVRLRLITLFAALAIIVTGCQAHLFSDCDRRPSLADWFDCYGPTGCYRCNGGCYRGNQGCENNGQCSEGCNCPGAGRPAY